GMIGRKGVGVAEGVLKPALWGKFKIAFVVLVLIAGSIGVGSAAREVPGPGPAAEEPAADRDRVGAAAPRPRHNQVPRTIAKWRHHADLAVHEKAARALAFSRGGGRLGSGGDDGRVRIWDVIRTRELLVLGGQGARPVRAVAFSSGGEFFAAGNDDGSVIRWDLRVKGKPNPD